MQSASIPFALILGTLSALPAQAKAPAARAFYEVRFQYQAFL